MVVARPNLSHEKRRALIPIVAAAFAELGYRRCTTAEVARRCKVRENVLYRLWPSKREMFIASIAFVFENAAELWRTVGERNAGGPNDPRSIAERILDYETTHHGEFGRYRIIFAGLNEIDDPAIRAALSDMYQNFAGILKARILEHRRALGQSDEPDADSAAWALIGLGTVSDVLRELKLVSEKTRKRMFDDVGRLLLHGFVRNAR